MELQRKQRMTFSQVEKVIVPICHLSKEIKIETIDVGPEKYSSVRESIICDLVISNLAESYAKLCIQEDIENESKGIKTENVGEDRQEDINGDQEQQVEASVAYHGKIKNQENSLVEFNGILHKEEDIEEDEEVAGTSVHEHAATANFDDILMGSDVNIVKEEDIKENIEEVKEEVTWTPKDEHAATGNCDDLACGSNVTLEEEDIEEVARTSTDKYAATGNYDRIVVESDENLLIEEGKEMAGTSVKSHAATENPLDSIVESDLNLHKEYTEGDKPGMAGPSVDNLSTTEHEYSFVENRVKLQNEGNLKEVIEEIKRDIEDDKRELVESDVLSTENKGKVFQPVIEWGKISGKFEKYFDSNRNILSYMRTFVKDKNNYFMCNVDGCQRSKIYFDSSSIKLFDVSVDLVDLFEEIARLYPQIPIQRHINAEFCPCIFCTEKYRLLHPVKGHVEMSRSKGASETSGSHKVDLNSDALLVPSDILVEPITDNSRSGSCVNEPQQPKIYYDTARFKLIDVSVVLKDLFQEIERCDPQKPVQRHINSKVCSCIFCTGKFEPQNILKTFTEKNTSISVIESRHRSEDNLRESTYEKWNSCTLCPARFKFMYSLKRHCAMQHHVYLCSECPRKFQLESDLHTHLKTHPANNQYSCVFCPFKGRVEPELEIHARCHVTERFFSCAECLLEFSESFRLQNHLLKHATKKTVKRLKQKPVSNAIFSNLKPTYSCRLRSSEQFKQVSNAVSCIKLNQSSYLNSDPIVDANAQSFLYDYSSFKIITKSSVACHSLTHVSEFLLSDVQNQENESLDHGRLNVSYKGIQSSHCVAEDLGESINKKWHCCTVCPARFRFMHGLTKHSAMNHRMYMCSKCPSKFQFDFDLQTHRKTHPVIGFYLCAFCAFKGRVEAELEIHARIHANAKLFSCSLCLKEFDKDYSLLVHIEEHKRLGDFTKFQNQTDLGEHTAVHSNNELVSNEEVGRRSADNVLISENSVFHSNYKSVSNEVGVGSKDDSSLDENLILYSSNELVLSKEVNVGSNDGASLDENMLFYSRNESFLIEVGVGSKDHTSPGRNSVFYLNNKTILNKTVDVGSMIDTSFVKNVSFLSNEELVSNKYAALSGENSVVHSRDEPGLNKEVDVGPKDNAVTHGKLVLHSKNELALNEEFYVGPTYNVSSSEKALVHSNDKPVLNEVPRFRLQSNGPSSENVERHTSSRSVVDSRATFGKENDTAESEEATQHTDSSASQSLLPCTEDILKISSLRHVYSAARSRLRLQSRLKRSRVEVSVDSHLEVSIKKKMICDYEEHHLVSETLCKKAGANIRDQCDSNINVSSSQTESIPGNTNNSIQELGTTSDSCGIKLVPVSVVLEDLFLKISKENSQKPIQRHINSELCRCVFCTGTFKLHDGMKTETKKNRKGSSCSEQYRGEHVDNMWISCTLCPARFKFTHSLTRHCATDHDAYMCTECSQKFEAKSDLQTHMKTHSRNKQYFCPFCSFKSKVEAELKIHARNHTLENLFSCAQCFMEFNKSNSLLDHILTHRTMDAAVKSKNKTNLSEHTAVFSNDVSSNSRLSNLNQHLAKVHTTERSFSCWQCHAAFKQKSHLKQHVAVIHSEKDSVSLPNSAANFKSRHNPSTPLAAGPFACPDCPATFMRKWHLNRHLISHSSKKPFSCLQCFATFKRKEHLTRHSVLHSKKKSFPVNCSAASKMEKKLQQHSISHLSMRPFRCPNCDATFSWKDQLTRHLAIHSVR